MNQVIISGNIVGNTNNNQKLYTYYKGNENNKSVLNFLVSVKRPFGKKDENGYYPSDLWAVKAFGLQADFIDQYYNAGDAISLTGYLAVDKGGEREDGTKYPDRTYICLQSHEFVPVSYNKNNKEAGSGIPTSKNDNVVAPKAKAAPKKASNFKVPF